MEFVDEKIRRVINQVEEQEELNKQNIYEGITIHGEYYEFAEKSFFADQFKIHMPYNRYSDVTLRLPRLIKLLNLQFSKWQMKKIMIPLIF